MVTVASEPSVRFKATNTDLMLKKKLAQYISNDVKRERPSVRSSAEYTDKSFEL